MRIVNSLIAIIVLAVACGTSKAQSPAPIVVQAATAATPAPAPAQTQGAPEPASVQSALKVLEELKIKNDDVLRKQEATLQQLDDIVHAVEQLRIYSKRG
jgi:hypothetical protein